ncbi:MAG: multidrug ABC transporter permease, partial [Marivivens sp.]|nr:multidrug ABC transporter permease [Marivivens sp.]
SAPSMNPDVICDIGLTDGAVITSGAGDREAQQQAASDLALVLRTGALPITLEASTFEQVSATLGADSLRAGLTAGLIGLVLVGVWLFLGVGMQHPQWVLVFVVLGAVFMGGLGIIAAIFANKFDQLAAISNFVVTPLSFLSGTFYSIDALPPVLNKLSHVNPFFYIIDGVRFGMIGVSDGSPWRGLWVAILACAVVTSICWYWFKRGYRLKA